MRLIQIWNVYLDEKVRSVQTGMVIGDVYLDKKLR